MTDSEIYFDPEIEKVRKLGYQNGLAGKMDSRVKYRMAYMSGYQTGTKERAKNIYDARVKNIKKVREAKKC